MSALKPCPFCGSANVDIVALYHPSGNQYFVGCGPCGATSPHCKTEERAAQEWNQRRPGDARGREYSDYLRKRYNTEPIIMAEDLIAFVYDDGNLIDVFDLDNKRGFAISREELKALMDGLGK